MLTRKEFEKIQKTTGFNPELLEKVYHLTRILNEIQEHPVLKENSDNDISIRLEATNKNFSVYPHYILQQFKNNNAIYSLTYIVICTSFFMLAFMCYQSFNKIETLEKQNKDFSRLIKKIK